MATTAVDDATPTGPPAIDPFRQRLLDGLAAAIDERGYRASTVADIVRHARTSKRTFYDQFPSQGTVLSRAAARQRRKTRRADPRRGRPRRRLADPDPAGRRGLRRHIESTPALTLAWIRELPSLDAAARPSQRRNTQLLTSLLVNLSDTPAMRNADLPPLTPAKAVILVGGLRELTAQVVEDGHSVRDIVEPAVQASIALLGYRG